MTVDARLVDAVLRCVARWGVAKTTMEDVAREASCSRATLYRAFPGGKESLFRAVVKVEVERTFDVIIGALEAADDLAEALVAAVNAAAHRFRGHAALQFLLAHESGLVLPHLAFHHLDSLLARVSAVTAPSLTHFVADPHEAARLGEWITRIAISYTCSPSPGIDLTDPTAVRRLVQTFVLPGLSAPAVN